MNVTEMSMKVITGHFVNRGRQLMISFFLFMLQFGGEMAAAASGVKEKGKEPSFGIPDTVTPCFPGIPPASLPELKQPLTQPQETLSHNVSVFYIYCRFLYRFLLPILVTFCLEVVA